MPDDPPVRGPSPDGSERPDGAAPLPISDVPRSAPTATGDPDVVDGGLFGADQPCFGCGPRHAIGMRLRFERIGDEVVTRFVPHDRFQGPPGIMHGGLVMTLADEVAAWSIIRGRGKFGFTTGIKGRFRRPIRIDREVEGRARIIKDRARLIDVAVRIAQDGEDAFTGELSFVVLDRRGAEKMLGTTLPPEWNEFAR